jgi:hypothetical protein
MRDSPKRPGTLEHKEETQRKSPTNLGRRDRKDFKEKNWLNKARIYLETVSVCKHSTPTGKRVSTREVK